MKVPTPRVSLGMASVLCLAMLLATFALGSASSAADARPTATPGAIPGRNKPLLPAQPPQRYLVTGGLDLPPTNSPPELVLTGIVDLLGKKRAFLMRTEHGQPVGSYSLTEGDKRDGSEVLTIDARAETVCVRNAGLEMTLTL